MPVASTTHPQRLAFVPQMVDKKKQKHTKQGRDTHLVCDSTRHVALLEIKTFKPKNVNFVKRLKESVDSLRYNNVDTLFIGITRNSGGKLILKSAIASLFIPGKEPSCNIIAL